MRLKYEAGNLNFYLTSYFGHPTSAGYNNFKI
jgi:hypothetical protein